MNSSRETVFIEKSQQQFRQGAKVGSGLLTTSLLSACGGGGGSNVQPDQGGYTLVSGVYVGTDSADPTFDKSTDAASYVVDARGGDDTILTGSGADVVRPGTGADKVATGAGDDHVVVVGTTTANEYAATDIPTELKPVVSLDTLNGRSSSEAVAGEILSGEAHDTPTGDTLHLYGTLDLSVVELSGFEVYKVNSDITFAPKQLVDVTLSGNTQSTLRLTSPEVTSVNIADLTLSGINRIDVSENVEIVFSNYDELETLGVTVLSGAGTVKVADTTGSLTDGVVTDSSVTFVDNIGTAITTKVESLGGSGDSFEKKVNPNYTGYTGLVTSETTNYATNTATTVETNFTAADDTVTVDFAVSNYTLKGNGGEDTFVFDANHASYNSVDGTYSLTVADFNSGDVLKIAPLSTAVPTSFGVVDLNYTQLTGKLTFTDPSIFGTSTVTINMKDATVNTLTASDLRASLNTDNQIEINFNRAPVKNGDPTISITRGSAQTLELSDFLAVTDPDGDALTFTINQLPTSQYLTLQKADGTVISDNGTQLNETDFAGLKLVSVEDSQTGSAGTIEYVASDGSSTTSGVVTLSINNASNDTPEYIGSGETYLSSATASASATELADLETNQTLVSTTSKTAGYFIDADGEALTFTLSGTDADSFEVVTSTANSKQWVALKADVVLTAGTTLAVDVTAKDGENASVTQSFSYYVASQNGDNGPNTLTGTAGNDIILGDAITATADLNPETDPDNDILNGGDGNDHLNGIYGNDTLNGGAGNDLLKGRYGDDTITGGTGADTLWYSFYTSGTDWQSSEGNDTFTDFTPTVLDEAGNVVTQGDRIHLSDIKYQAGEKIDTVAEFKAAFATGYTAGVNSSDASIIELVFESSGTTPTASISLDLASNVNSGLLTGSTFNSADDLITALGGEASLLFG